MLRGAASLAVLWMSSAAEPAAIERAPLRIPSAPAAAAASHAVAAVVAAVAPAPRHRSSVVATAALLPVTHAAALANPAAELVPQLRAGPALAPSNAQHPKSVAAARTTPAANNQHLTPRGRLVRLRRGTPRRCSRNAAHCRGVFCAYGSFARLLTFPELQFQGW